MKSLDIAWVAGILEGEGCFVIVDATPRILVEMTDEDIIVRLRNIISPKSKIGVLPPRRRKNKPSFILRIHGNLAIQWMLTVYTLMGARRKAKINEILLQWDGSSRSNAVRSIMLAKNISRKEATEVLSSLVM